MFCTKCGTPADNKRFTGEWQRIDINRGGLPEVVAEHDMGHHGIAAYALGV
ncbi:MAG: hypothetical protein ACREEM_41290 [Blastocatellia bacterium]